MQRFFGSKQLIVRDLAALYSLKLGADLVLCSAEFVKINAG